MIEVPAALVDLVHPWAALYEDSKTVSDVVTATHLLGLLVGGGAAVTLDRETLALVRKGNAAGPELLGRLDRTHRWVLVGIVLLLGSGLLQTAADLKTFLPAPLFWGKLALFALLLANGWVMLRSERDAMPQHRHRAILDVVWRDVLATIQNRRRAPGTHQRYTRSRRCSQHQRRIFARPTRVLRDVLADLWRHSHLIDERPTFSRLIDAQHRIENPRSATALRIKP